MTKYTTYKKSSDYSYALGIFPTLELLTARPEAAEAVFVAPNNKQSVGLSKIQSLCAARSIPCIEDSKNIRNLSRSDNCYAVGVFKKFSATLQPTEPHVILINPDDAGNLGTIMRTMLGFGHHDLAIITPAADIFDPKTIRASMGAVFRQRVAHFTSLENYRTHYQHHLYPFLLDTTNLLANTTFEPPYSLVFGNEGGGLPAEYHQIGTPVRIEQSKEIDSLNLAVSVSIALYKSYSQIK